MKTVVSLTAIFALAAGFVCGHFLWPVRKSVRETRAEAASRRLVPTSPGDQEAQGDLEQAPEIWTVDRVMQAVGVLAQVSGATARSEAVAAIMTHLEPADAPALAKRLAPMAHDRAVQALYSVVLDHWTAFDAEATVRHVAALDNASVQAVAMPSAFHTWAAEDIDAASKFVDKLPPGLLHNQCADILVSAAARIDPRRALVMANALPAASSRNETTEIFNVWASNDLDGAVKAAQGLPEGRQRGEAMAAVMSEWARADASAALEWAVKNNAERGMGDAVQNAFGVAAIERPDLAASYLAKIDDGAQRDHILGTLAIRWASEDREAAKRWALSLEGDDRSQALEGLVGGVQYDDPATAFELAQAIEDPRQRGRSVAGVIGTWADRDPDAAWKAAQELEPGREKDTVIASVLGSLARTNPMAAAEALADAGDSPTLRSATSDVARAWAEVDPQSALRWIERLPAGEARDLATNTLGAVWVQNDPIAASAWAESRGTDATRSELAVMWATNDPQAAVEWSMQVDKASDGSSAFDQAVGYWAANDARRAAAWASALPRGKNRDTAYAQLGEAALYDEPETAMGYVDQIGDPARRAELRAALYNVWQGTDENEARRWRASSTLSAAELAALDNAPQAATGDSGPECVCPPTTGP